jgi:aspartate/glutamate racemase
LKQSAFAWHTHSTAAVDYYRSTVAAYRQKRPGGSSPSIIINSIDLKKVVHLGWRKRLTMREELAVVGLCLFARLP